MELVQDKILSGKILSDTDRLMIELTDLRKCRESGDWESFVDKALIYPRTLPYAFSDFDKVPDELKYSFAIEAYTCHGDAIPSVRKAVRTARRYGSPELPAELVGQDFITVYRAGEEPIEKARYRISWTTDVNTAIWFHERNISWFRRPSHVFRAKIKPEDCIAYTNSRNEHEIMQYRKVFDVEDITGTL